mgnify:CR=1 FL=1
MYNYLKDYIVENDGIKNGKKMVFYLVGSDEINKAEIRMKKIFPDSLREFYRQIGWGFFGDESKNFINMLMSPSDIADFYCSEGNYEYAEEREFLSENRFVFFEVDANCHITMKLQNGIESGIFFGADKIAESLSEFIKKMSIDTNYYGSL